jgi:hypothetical protein
MPSREWSAEALGATVPSLVSGFWNCRRRQCCRRRRRHRGRGSEPKPVVDWCCRHRQRHFVGGGLRTHARRRLVLLRVGRGGSGGR